MGSMNKPGSKSVPTSYTEAERVAEEKRVRFLQRLVDFTLALIAQSDISLEEAQRLVHAVRNRAYAAFPEKQETFELIYTPRFRRLIAAKFGMQ
jgi:hypothetical protein